MRTETITHKIYKFDELSDDAKEKAREWARSGHDNEWYDGTYEDAKRIAAIMGIDIDTIYFNGFWSQGDGACFEGSYEYRAGSVKALKAEVPEDEELHTLVEELARYQRTRFYSIKASMKQLGHCQHSGCMSVSVTCDNNGYEDVPECEQGIIDLMRQFADWIYNQLESNYEWMNADEQVDENIIANEYEFTENGEIYS